MARTRSASHPMVPRWIAAACRSRLALLVAGLVCVISPAPGRAQEVKSLDWTAFSVDARLDSTGTLVVRERQTILFTGDWNGGERRFDVRQGQRFVFKRMVRIDSLTGAEIPMRDGSLDVVDGYRMTDRHTLRWRSRLPTDVPFLNTKITYLLEYEYADILLTEGDTYRLNHEFAFRDRAGTIANFDLTLRVDPAWRAPASFTGTFRQAVLEPGIGYVVNIPLAWRGVGQPSAVRRSPPAPMRLALAGAMLLVIVAMTVPFLRDEVAVGRFAPLPPRSAIDRAWLETHILSMKPEVVGYAWDESVGAPEVSAVLARLVNERKLSSRVETAGWKMFSHPVLHLEMLVPRQEFHGYERALIDAFFASGATTTSTDQVRKRYEKVGFDPASILRQPLIEQFTQTFGVEEASLTPPRRWPVTLAIVVAGIALLVAALSTRRADAEVTLLSVAIVGVPVFLFARLQSYLWRKRVVRPEVHLLRIVIPMALLTGVVCWAMVTGARMLGLLTLAGLVVLVIAAMRSTLNGARWTGSTARLRRRKDLAAAREFCKEQLGSATPALDDSWYPYLLAFGLGRHVEKWFRAFDAESTMRQAGTRGGSSATFSRSSSGDVSSTTSGGGSGFSGFGGGGGFSGAGATVAFGSAVSAFASGVSAPSSSSGGGGSSSSGGSSGGGGGGGW